MIFCADATVIIDYCVTRIDTPPMMGCEDHGVLDPEEEDDGDEWLTSIVPCSSLEAHADVMRICISRCRLSMFVVVMTLYHRAVYRPFAQYVEWRSQSKTC